MGVACPLASSRVTQSSFPVSESKARKRLSLVPAMKFSPPAVAIDPPRLGTPVLGMHFASSSSTTPRGTFQAISPVFKSTAFKVPQGGFWHGKWFSSQKREYVPHWLPHTYASAEPAGCVVQAHTAT